MNYGNQNLRELLAGEYVLGLLHGAARLRFERLLIEDARLRGEVVSWERKFSAWNRVLKPLIPPNSVWRKLELRLKAETRASRKLAGSPGVKGFWSGAAVIAAAIVLVVGIFIGRNLVTTPITAPGYLAVMSNPKGQPLWLISVHPQSRRVDMKALSDNTPPPGKSYELWMLPGNGKPVSLGLMNSTGIASETLSPQLMAALVSAKGLAISVEPHGGSPTGQPTGPVVYVAPIISA
ncbi:MAG TPA: anti-sigma factor [Gammaproteobacteria bacterium]|nr:anti-sigma factor [Gammaproteobacteria bacterium]